MEVKTVVNDLLFQICFIICVCIWPKSPISISRTKRSLGTSWADVNVIWLLHCWLNTFLHLTYLIKLSNHISAKRKCIIYRFGPKHVQCVICMFPSEFWRFPSLSIFTQTFYETVLICLLLLICTKKATPPLETTVSP